MVDGMERLVHNYRPFRHQALEVEADDLFVLRTASSSANGDGGYGGGQI